MADVAVVNVARRMWRWGNMTVVNVAVADVAVADVETTVAEARTHVLIVPSVQYQRVSGLTYHVARLGRILAHRR